VYTDALVHRSAVDACRLSGARVERFAHNNPKELEARIKAAPPERRALIVVEGIYSMEGDIGALPEFVDIRNRYGAYLLVDEAHSVGVLGDTGRGVDEHFNLPPDSVDVWTGSLSKALAAPAGYVAGSRELIVYLQHEAAPFVFSAALAPAASAAAKAAIETLRREPERLVRMRANAEHLRRGLVELGYRVGETPTPVIPVKVGGEVAAYYLARSLWELGVAVTAVVHPAVPRGNARLRVCVTAAHDTQDIHDAIRAFAAAATSRGEHHVHTAIA